MATTEEARQWRGTTSLLEASRLRVQASEAEDFTDWLAAWEGC